MAVVFGKRQVAHFLGGEDSTKRRMTATWKPGRPSTRSYTVGGSGHEHGCVEDSSTTLIKMSKSLPLDLVIPLLRNYLA